MKKLLIPVLSLSLVVPTFAQAHDHQPMISTPASDLRADLDYLLSEHFALAVTAMTKAYDEADDWEAAEAALDQNAQDMTPAIASIYGEDGAAEFERIFRGHNDYTDDIVQATKDQDMEARAAAEEEVEEFVVEFSTFLGAATEGNLPQEAAEDAIRLHEAQVLNTFDYYVAGEYENAYQTFREGYAHMYDISKALSGAIVAQMPEMFDGSTVDAPASELRSILNMLASEHFALAAIGMQKGYDQAPDYDFVSWAEDMNTADFKAAMASIYGDEGAAQFEQVWQADHIDAQANLVSATLANDEDAAYTARAQLYDFAESFGAFLSVATEGNLPEADAVAAISAHEDLVVKTFDEYVAGDFNASYETFREGFAFMFGVGEALGGAIVNQMPDQFHAEMMPEKMPKTGMGGASEQSGLSAASYALFGALLLLTSVFMIRRKVATNE